MALLHLQTGSESNPRGRYGMKFFVEIFLMRTLFDKKFRFGPTFPPSFSCEDNIALSLLS